MKKIKVIFFDWGGVLIDDPGERMKKYCARILGAKEKEFNRSFAKYINNFHTGRITEHMLWQRINNELGLSNRINRSLWTEAYRLYYSPRPLMFKLAKQLRRQGHKIVLLSNTEKPIIRYANSRYYKKMNLFHDIIASCHIGEMKPRKKFYKVALKRLKIKPAEALLIDDRKENIEGGIKAGFKTIMFKNYQQLLKELRGHQIGYRES